MIIFKKDFTIFSIPPGLRFFTALSYLKTIRLKLLLSIDHPTRCIIVKNVFYINYSLCLFNSTSSHYSSFIYENYL